MAMERVNARLPEDLGRRMRGAVRGMMQRDPSYSLTQFFIDAVTAHVETLERTHNGGQRWPPSENLKRGARLRG